MDVLKAMVLGRWVVLLAVVPYAAMLGRYEGAGGALVPLVVGAIVLYYFAAVDLKNVRLSGMRRLALHRSRGSADVLGLETARALFGGLAAVLSVVLLFVAPGAGLWALVSLVVIALMDVLIPRWSPRLIEVALPAGAVVLPMLIVSMLVGGLPDSIAAGTFVGALALAVYLLLTLIRDEQFDLGESRVTTATVLGGAGASVVVFVFAALASVIAIGASSEGMWHWPVSAGLAVAAMATLWMVASGASSIAAGFWLAVSVVVAVAISLTA